MFLSSTSLFVLGRHLMSVSRQLCWQSDGAGSGIAWSASAWGKEIIVLYDHHHFLSPFNQSSLVPRGIEMEKKKKKEKTQKQLNNILLKKRIFNYVSKLEKATSTIFFFNFAPLRFWSPIQPHLSSCPCYVTGSRLWMKLLCMDFELANIFL